MLRYRMVYNLSLNSAYFRKETLRDIEVMQFTGLLDKHGKEIYEGDIVDGTLDVSMENGCTEDFRAPVVWSEMGYWDIGAPSSEIEIIGNIYENPDLLTTT